MKTYVLNLLIVNDDKLKLTELKNYLDNRFGTSINIAVFQNNDSMLKKIEKYTNIVIVDYLDEKNEKSFLRLIKEVNPKIEIILHSSNEDIGNAVERYGEGVTELEIKKKEERNKTTLMIYKIVAQPFLSIIKRLRVSKFPTMFL
jgi:DNA-binding NtrC family response regulator